MRLLLILSLLIATNVINAHAAYIEGVERATIFVGGKEYVIPVGNNDRKQEIYYLKKALGGDKDARELFLGGAEERLYFIGWYSPLWLKVTKNSEEIIDPNA